MSIHFIPMKFRIPGTDMNIRLFEPVATTDTQYGIVDVGVEYKHGGVDSIAVGGSAYTLREAIKAKNAEVDKKAEEKATDRPTATEAPAAA